MLTDLKVRNEKPAAARREIPDGKIAGLYLVVQTTGAKSWAVRYRVDGKPKKFTIGAYPAIDLAAARRKAQGALGEVAGGTDPSAAKVAAREARKAAESPSDRVEIVVDAFMKRVLEKRVSAIKNRKLSESWAREAERLLRAEVLPVLGRKRLTELRKSHINEMLDGIVDRGSPIIANRTLAIFRRVCNWAVERDIVARSPCENVPTPAAEESRSRVLADEEIRLAWTAFDTLGWPFGQVAKLLLLTGARRDEVGSATWGEFDLRAKTWTIVRERSKNGIAHEVPLSDAAVAILAALPRIGERKDALVFSTTGRTAVSGFSRAKAEIDKAMLAALTEEAGEGREGEPIAHWQLHDLRRTCASGMAGMGIAPHVVEAVLNHRSGIIKGISAVYNRYSYANEKRAALDAWAQRLHAIVNPESGSNVLPFPVSLR